MVSLNELLEHVDEAFDARPAEIVAWADPNPGRDPDDDAYSHVTKPERWRIVAARADAWIHALTALNLATVREVSGVEWSKDWLASNLTGCTDLIVPNAPDALSLVIARLDIGDVPNAGVVVGAGVPAEELVMVPDCACDACDSGSDDALGVFDELMINVVGGTFRRLSRGKKSVTTTRDGRQSRNMSDREIRRVLPLPASRYAKDWSELAGPSWLESGCATGTSASS